MMPLGGGCQCKDNLLSSSADCKEFDQAHCEELRKIVDALTTPGKGLLAADETPGSLEERFQDLDIENNDISRRNFREMLLSADDKCQLSQYISGVILHHETVYQKTSDGVEFIEFLRQRNIIPGIKVDKGQVEILGTAKEKTTQGLDNLQERCIQYKRDGCHFSKWRCTYTISETTPSQLAMATNAHVLARFASICQSARIVPIVEPEILAVGEHGLDKALEVHEKVLSILFRTLNEHNVLLEFMILKPAMVLPGSKSTNHSSAKAIGEYTVRALQRTVPPAVPGILFLSGGQSDEDAVSNLQAINACDRKKPWILSFCYGRALQNVPMKIWKGKSEKAKDAQAALLENARLCSEASLGK